MSQKIQFRRGTNNERQSVVFSQGEPAWVTDTRELFIGDGVTTGGISISVNTGYQSFTGLKRFNNNIICQEIHDTVDNTSINVDARSFYDQYNQVSVDAAARTLLDSVGNTSVDWISRITFDSLNADSIDWNNRTLFDSGNINISMNWNTKILSGNWQIVTSTAPTGRGASGIKGQAATSGGYLFVCTGTNQWGRVQLSSAW